MDCVQGCGFRWPVLFGQKSSQVVGQKEIRRLGLNSPLPFLDASKRHVMSNYFHEGRSVEAHLLRHAHAPEARILADNDHEIKTLMRLRHEQHVAILENPGERSSQPLPPDNTGYVTVMKRAQFPVDD